MNFTTKPFGIRGLGYKTGLRLVTFVLLTSLFLGINSVFAAVNVTTPSATLYPCSTYPTAYSALGNIVITEGSDADFVNNQPGVTFILAAPANFEFQPGVGSVTHATGSSRDITASSINVTATEIIITLTVGSNGGPSAMDQLTISGIQVRALAGAGPSNITRGGDNGGADVWGGTAVVNGAVVGGITYGSLYSTTFPSANAGIDQIICSSSTNFEAAPLFDPNLNGTWTLVSGTGSITDPNDPTSAVTGLSLGDNIFQWEIVSGACTSSSIVTITTQAAGIGCTVIDNDYSAVTLINPLAQDTVCPPNPADVTEFTLANPGPFNVGDKVLVIQMQGAIVDLTDAAVEDGGVDGTFGDVLDYNGAGNYEYAIIASKTGSVITFSQNLINQYDVGGKVQIVSVPQFANHTISSTITGTPWDNASGTGGVMVFEVLGTLTLNGTISMDYRGFIGGGNAVYPGAPLSGAALSYGVWVDGGTTARCSKGIYSTGAATLSTSLRGEGIATDPSHAYGRGALANGGGSGGGWNGGAGGGSNVCAGGRGGYEYSTCHNAMGVNPYYVGVTPTYNGGIGLPAQNLDARMHGVGGHPLSPGTNRVFMGGGGGAGNGDGGCATAGGNGGGIIIISAGTIAGTSGTISAIGQNGYNNGVAPFSCTADATGAGGAGGSIILDVDTYTITDLQVVANGGKGGNQNQANTCHGNGGGGSGGFIKHKGITPNVTISAAGGRHGIQRPDATGENSLPLSNDNACAGGTTYGAEYGGGDCAASVLEVEQVVPQKGCCSDADLGPDQSLCGLASILLSHGTASTTNKTFQWYKNGVLLPGETNPTYTATSNGLYSVVVDSVVGGFTFCSVTDAMLITNTFQTPYLGPDQLLCDPSFLDLSPFNVGSFPGSTTWEWTFDGAVLAGETTPYLNNVTAAGTYCLTATAAGGCGPTTGCITLTTLLPVTVDACRNTTGSVDLSVSGGNGGPYEWYANETGGSSLFTGTTYTTPSLSSTTTYWVEDLGLYSTTIGPPLSYTTDGTLSPAGNRASGSSDIVIEFDVLQDMYLEGLTLQYWANSCGGNVSYSINIDNVGTGFSQTRTGTAGACGSGLQTYTVTFATPIFIPAGTGYTIDPSGSSHAFAYFNSGFTYNTTYSLIHMVKTNASSSTSYAAYFDWQVSYEANCTRVPVVAQIGGCTLPVELVDFTGKLSGGNVYLDWATTAEINNDYFIVERSLNGKDFESIATINGNGNTTSLTQYAHTDMGVPNGVLYYRLMQVDYDGSSAKSKVVAINNQKASIIDLYPNPFNNGTNLLVSSPFDYTVQVTIRDLSGKTRQVPSTYNSNEVIVLGEDLSAGAYIVEVRTEYETKTFKIIKVNK